jgi:hypothetical protein
MGIIIFLFFLFFLLTYVFIFNRDKIMSMLYLALFLYSFFPLIARYYYPDKISIYSHVSIKTIDTLYISTAYIILFFLILFTMYFIFFQSASKKHIASNQVSDERQKDLLFGFIIIRRTNSYHDLLYLIILSTVSSLLLIKLLINFNNISYFNQSIVKSDKIWSFSLEFAVILVVIGYFAFKTRKNQIVRFMLLFINLFLTAVLLLTLFKMGNRGILIPYILGIIYIYLESRSFKINLRFGHISKWFKIIFLLLIVISFSQFIRGNRGGEINTINFSVYTIFDFFKLEYLLFQDYTIPGNSLFFAIDNKVIDPLYVIVSNFNNGIFFLSYETVAEYISHLVAPTEWFGIGGYILTESFLLFGYLGVFFMPLFILVIYLFFYRKFLNVKDNNLKLFLGFLFVSLLTLTLVRGQSYLLFKSIYMYFAPALVFFSWICGYKISIKRIRR